MMMLFDQQLENWCEKLFSYQPETVTIELRAYIEDWEKSIMKKKNQRTCILFLEKYGGLYLYDINFDKRYSIDDEDIHVMKGYGFDLIFNPENPDITSTDHENFFINDEFLNRILETDQNSDIALKVIHKEFSLPSINDNGTDSSSNLRNISKIVSYCHQLQRKRQKKFMVIHRNQLMISS